MRRISFTLVFLCTLATLIAASDKHPYTFDDHISMKRLSAPVLSPDGKWIAFSVTSYDKAANKGSSDIYLVPTAGGDPVQLTSHEAGDHSPAWSPDGKTIAFISSRSGSSQIWLISTGGGEAWQLTDIATGADGPEWSPDGKKILFTSMVWPGCDDECNAKRLKEMESSKVKAKIIDNLLYRHWNTWRDDGRKSHLFLVDVKSGEHLNLIPDAEYDVPPFPFGGSGDYTFSPDGKEICFTAKVAPNPATHTNLDLFLIPAEGGEPKNITEEYEGEDFGPVFSPDGRFIAFGVRERPTFEADQAELYLYDRESGRRIKVTEDFDRNVGEYVWSPDMKSIYITAGDEGHNPIRRISLTAGGEIVVKGGWMSGINLSLDGKTLVFSRQSLSAPAEIFSANSDGSDVTQLTFFNKPPLDNIEMGEVKEEWFEGADGDRVQIFVILPPGFDPSKKWPMVVLIHGGPQGAFANNFHYRWNAQLFASPGYVAACINFHGSTGYGQKFVDSVSKNWGGSPYEDIIKGTDHMISLGYVDPKRIGAAGGSFGGYMVNWICSQTDKFACLISHAGLFNLESMYGGTEELWFPEWELDGPYWENREYYDKWSPHRFVNNMKTPTLVIHGQHDYRVPVGQAMEMFTALQRQGVPSRFIYYPDETHFVQKPQNAELWYKEVHAWFERWIGVGPAE